MSIYSQPMEAYLTPCDPLLIRPTNGGVLLYFRQAVDPTLAAALSSISFRQSKGTTAVMKHAINSLIIVQPIQTHPFAIFGMSLALNTDRSYLSELKGKSRAAACIYLARKEIQTSTMVQSWFCLQSSNTYWHLPPKRNLRPYFTASKRQSHSVLPSKK
eukprot:CCRYP_004864-RA/>CCRYP_004864-RA protein AED:0.43 eAED:0.48 QI:0/0/0/1/0/0/3/0/158